MLTISAIALTTLLLSPVLPTSNSVSSDNVISPTSIGRFAYTEKVEEETKVYISSSDISFVSSTGRPVYKEEYTETIIDITNPGTGLFKGIGNSGTIKKYRYYYIASPNGKTKITSIITLNNSYSSFLIMLKYIEDLAICYYGVDSPIDVNNIVMGYIRSFNPNYIESTLWKVVAGGITPAFASYVGTIGYDRGITPYEYFGAFVSTSQYNESGHYSRREEYTKSNLGLIEPIDRKSEIDLIHMIASLDALYYYTGDLEIIHLLDRFGIPKEKELLDLSSWAGDMQQAIYNLHNSYGDAASGMITSFDDILAGNYGFDTRDLIADIDAYNMAPNYLYSNSIYDAFATYHKALIFKNINRYEKFLVNLEYDWTSQGCASAGIAKERIFDYAMLTIDNTCTIRDGYSPLFQDNFKYAILFNNVYVQQSGDVNISYDLRYNVANSFYSFLIQKASE